MSNQKRVPFRLRTPINLVDLSQVVSKSHRLEPGDYELSEIDNPFGGALNTVVWLVVIKDNGTEGDVVTDLGTSLPNWEDHGEFLNGYGR